MICASRMHFRKRAAARSCGVCCANSPLTAKFEGTQRRSKTSRSLPSCARPTRDSALASLVGRIERGKLFLQRDYFRAVVQVDVWVVRIMQSIVLVICLGWIKLFERRDLGDDGAA